MDWKFNDGGRKKAGYLGRADYCVCRAIAIAAGLDYEKVYQALAEGNATERKGNRKRTAREGIHTKRKWFKDYMVSLGFTWVPTMQIGSGCKVHLKAEELPAGRLVCNVSRHLCAVIDGVLHDTHDCSREGKRCVYGYWVFGMDICASNTPTSTQNK